MARFGTAINCMDGRVQAPVAYWLKVHFGVMYVDTITEAGPVKAISEGVEDIIASVQSRLQVSLQAHSSEIVAVVGHHDCAANPGDRDQQCKQIQESVEIVRSWQVAVPVIGLYVNDLGHVNKVC
jgi:carbonic anhydrase